MARVDRSDWLTCDRCGEPAKVLHEHEDAMANDGRGTPMRPARHCGSCVREMQPRKPPPVRNREARQQMAQAQVDVSAFFEA